MGDVVSGDAVSSLTSGNPTNLVDLAPISKANDAGASTTPLAGDAIGIEAEMEGIKQNSSPVDAQVIDFGYGMFSPRRNQNDVQSIIWDSSNGHYSLSERTDDSVLNVQPEVNTGLELPSFVAVIIRGQNQEEQ
ncbi:hypothetical protein L1987_10633 [Smallanthus sonchifolius]|uniref:Uncharacterized protein n=1 Tax=Smallanthus sonchifolius TaxID=185202 RepID=A0ACB9JSS6_9ASTR|nr:hypothetical protein L1987_10633 [Smallanthus sonchifolius]